MPLSCSILGCKYIQFVVCTINCSLLTIYIIRHYIYSSTICVGMSSSSLLKLLLLEADRLLAAAASSYPGKRSESGGPCRLPIFRAVGCCCCTTLLVWSKARRRLCCNSAYCRCLLWAVLHNSSPTKPRSPCWI